MGEAPVAEYYAAKLCLARLLAMLCSSGYARERSRPNSGTNRLTEIIRHCTFMRMWSCYDECMRTGVQCALACIHMSASSLAVFSTARTILHMGAHVAHAPPHAMCSHLSHAGMHGCTPMCSVLVAALHVASRNFFVQRFPRPQITLFDDARDVNAVCGVNAVIRQ